MNKQVVTIIGNKKNEVLTVSPNNPEYGWLAVQSTQPTFQEGFMRLGKRVAFIAGTVKQLEEYISGLNLVVGSELPGKIVIREQLEPIDANNLETGIKYPNAAAKEAGLMCSVGDQPVYRRAFYTPDLSIIDTLVQHHNGADIKEFMAKNPATANSSAIRNASPVNQ